MAKILIVDDHVLNREFLLTLLGFGGHELLEAADGVEGLEALESGMPDLVISDILMPNMDGYEFVGQLRKNPRFNKLPVIFYTATYREREATAMAEACGVRWVLPKPSEPDLILRTVNEALGISLTPPQLPASMKLPDARRFAGIDDQLAACLGEVEASSQQMAEIVRDAGNAGEIPGSGPTRVGLMHCERRLSASLSNLQAVGLRLTALIELGIEMAAERDPERLIAVACRVVQNIGVARYAVIAILDDSLTRIEHINARGIGDSALEAWRGAPPAEGVLGSLLVQRQPVRIGDISETFRLGLPARHPAIHSFLGVPLATASRVFGWIYLADKLGSNAFNEVDERAISTAAAQLAVAYENLILYDELQQHDAHLRLEVTQRVHAQNALHRTLRARMVMAECNHVLVHGADESVLLQEMCDTVVKTGAYSMAWIGFVNADQSVTPVAQAARHEAQTALLHMDSIAGCPQIAAVAHTGTAQGTPDIQADARLARWHALAEECGARSSLSLPLRTGSAHEVFAVLTIYEDQVHAFDASQVSMFEELADDIAYGMVHLRTLQARTAAENALRESESKLNNILVSIDNVVWSAQGEQLTSISAVAQKLFGYPVEELLRRPTLWLEMVHEDDRPLVRSWLHKLAGGGARTEAGCEYRIWRADGAGRWILMRGTNVLDGAGVILRQDGVLIDVTERKEYERRFEYLANHDGLTRLANRNRLADRLELALAQALREGRMVGLLFLDLDRFKDVNDSVGHSIGDGLLQAVAARLTGMVRNVDTVARQGGDEFIVLLAEPKDAVEVGQVAQRVIDGLARPFEIDGEVLHVSASIGATVYPHDADDMPTLLRNADTAMYRAKDEGGNNFQFYSRDMGQKAQERVTLEAALRRAVERQEFELVYQPKVDLSHGRIIGAEALIRWRHPEQGLISPLRFIPLAEDTGLIVPIGEWVMRTACRQNKAWQDAGLPMFRMAVNLSARQFRQDDLVQRVAAVLQEIGLDARYLELELTESLVMHDAEQFIGKMNRIKELGVRLSIDDFGTGYSSLSYLKRFPLDTLKIDQSFVREIVTDADDAAIVRSIISLGHSLNLKVIAEGVETEAQLAYLRRHRCDEMQGYYFSKPVSAAEFSTLLQEGKQLGESELAGPGEQTLLIVDDDAETAGALRRLLKQDGYEVLMASSSSEAFELLARHKVQVIVSDQSRPEMRGTDFLQRVKAHYPATMRIILSSHTDFQAILDAINGGAIHRFLIKPWEDEALRTSIREAFQHHWLLHGEGTLEDRRGSVQLWES